ncbi:MAG: aquaporin [Anaerolinea sp.]|nr:aquaporin [Anaerolinea sp.]
MNDKLLRAAIAEFLGTFTLVFVGAAVVATGAGLVAAALGHGLILVGIILAYGRISGAHVNPAVTLGLLVGRQITLDRAIFYWVAQFVGALVAAVLVRALLPDAVLGLLADGTTFNVGQTIGSVTSADILRAAAFEFVLTFFLVSAVYQAAVFGKLNNLEALAIGLTLAGSIFAGGVFTGASLNPARTLGPALIGGGNLDYVLPYLIGQLLAGAVAGVLHMTLFRPQAEPEGV